MCSLKAATACWRLEAGSWRLICQASFTAPVGTAGAPGLVLNFVASAVIIDPDTGFPKIIEASDEKPIVVKPAGVEPPLSVSFTPPCDPFVVEHGAATSISIRIETSDRSVQRHGPGRQVRKRGPCRPPRNVLHYCA
jgi:hypothetical protein